ncbi:MAG: C_GCAxxG_C_C family protein [Lachnospiraceae bacterium]|nr:C_GCAxxG_C_C family protein [Lachnospiraceae bacterium]
MESRVEKTIELHNKGYNCAQSVACTYCDLVGVDEVTMFKMTEGLGLGMGGMEGTCGALTGACVLAGMKNSSGNIDAPNSKVSTYKLSREILESFRIKNGSSACKRLKGIESGQMLRSCSGCIMDAAELVEKIIFPEEFKEM